MKNLIIILLLIPVLSYSQIDSSLKKVSKCLINYQENNNTGLIIEGFGTVITTIGLSNSYNRQLSFIGCIITLSGIFIEINSNNSIKNAALYLQGNSIKYNFGGK